MYNLQQSFSKVIYYVGNISKQPIQYTLDGKCFTINTPRKIFISKNFFRGFVCKSCGRCCKVNFYNCYSENEFNIFKKVYPEKIQMFDKKDLIVNNTKCNVYVTSHNDDGICPYLSVDNMCTVHEINPLHCAIPLMKFKNVDNITYITKEPYGRNWQFGCKAELTKQPITPYMQPRDLYLLTRVKALCDEWGVDTYIDKIIDTLKNNTTIQTIEVTDKTRNLSSFTKPKTI